MMALEIVIPAYNCAATLGRTLRSLTEQTNKNFSVMIIDDCSTQDIRSIVDEYTDTLSIHYVRNETNRGCGLTRQRGIDETEADYIVFVDADDVLTPIAVETFLAEIDRSQSDVIATLFLLKHNGRLDVRYYYFNMTHGKAYNVDYLRRFNIHEAEEAQCLDDYYLNYQAFCLTDNITLVEAITAIEIDTHTSVSHHPTFAFRGLREYSLIVKMVRDHVSQYVSDDVHNERAKKYNRFLWPEPGKHKAEIEKLRIWLESIEA
jgi:glycosyltransferase involved in cell wall biosynthesis